ncbi:MAG: thiamine phosphate synthase [Prevotella sp.]|nr:thiamine phosphate synthase [Prevotella sp.]
MKQVQFITHENDRFSYVDGARMALDGGCRWIQLRMKDATDDEVREAAAVIQPLCREHDAVFLLDDRVELAKELKADGVHLGRNDMPVSEARRVLGEEFIIGGTANTFEDVERLWREGADYIGCGPFRFTTTKANLSPVLGLDGYRSIITRMDAAGIDLPVVAIGGILRDDIPAVMATGVHGIALSGAVLDAENPVEEMRRIVNLDLPED